MNVQDDECLPARQSEQHEQTADTAPPASLWLPYVSCAPGPRKDDIPLGEDAAGGMVAERWSAVWVADGTSHSPVIWHFSARTLAQTLGQQYLFHLLAADGQLTPPSLSVEWLTETIAEVIARTLQFWNEELETRLAYPANREQLEQWFHQDAESDAEVLPFVDFSVTAGFALAIGEDEAATLLIGDCQAVVADKNQKIHCTPPSTTRLYFRLKWDELEQAYRFERIFSREAWRCAHWEQAQLVLLASDGVGQRLERLLTPCLSGNAQTGVGRLIQLLGRFPATTDDDKAVALLYRR